MEGTLGARVLLALPTLPMSPSQVRLSSVVFTVLDHSRPVTVDHEAVIGSVVVGLDALNLAPSDTTPNEPPSAFAGAMGETTNGDDIQDMYVRWIVWGRGPRPSPRMQMSGTLPFGSTRDFRPSPMGALAIANPDGHEGPLSGTLTPQFSGAMGGGGGPTWEACRRRWSLSSRPFPSTATRTRRRCRRPTVSRPPSCRTTWAWCKCRRARAAPDASASTSRSYSYRWRRHERWSPPFRCGIS
jgi:hypothetical protein